jgi:hypothetical protein
MLSASAVDGELPFQVIVTIAMHSAHYDVTSRLVKFLLSPFIYRTRVGDGLQGLSLYNTSVLSRLHLEPLTELN